MITGDGPSILRLANFVNGYPFKSDDLSGRRMPVIRIRQLLDPSVEPDFTDVDAPEVKIDDGDIIFSWSATLAVRRWNRGEALLNQHLFRVDPGSSVCRSWIAYVLETACWKLEPLMHGSAMTHVTRDMLRRVRVRTPSMTVQRKIADFLDAETARIDALIVKKFSLLQALERRFRRLVDESTNIGVLGALDPAAKLPRGWRFPMLRRCFLSIHYGIGEATSGVGVYPVLGMGNINDHGDVVGPPGGFVDEVDLSLLLRPGDLLFNRTNSLAKVGKVGLVRDLQGSTTFASYLVRLRVNHLADSNFLNYVLNAADFLRLARSVALPSIGQANLNPARYTELRVPLPLLREQESIARELDQERSHLNSLRSRAERQIHLLKEHRQALIIAVVAGETEVPGVSR